VSTSLSSTDQISNAASAVLAAAPYAPPAVPPAPPPPLAVSCPSLPPSASLPVQSAPAVAPSWSQPAHLLSATAAHNLLAVAAAQLRSAPLASPQAKKILELLAIPDGDPFEIFKHRLLCRGGIGLLAAGTGVGKSTLLGKAMVHWVLEMECFGFQPTHGLRIIYVQAENDVRDCKEQVQAALKPLNLTAEKLQMVNDRLLFITEVERTGATFCEVLRRAAIDHRADLIVIDPVLAYVECEANSQLDVGNFLRRQLKPILDETNTAALLVHHTAKPVAQKNRVFQRSDAYVGSGSSEWGNVPRVVVSIEATDVSGDFLLKLAKRGSRARWIGEDGKPTNKRYLRQSRIPGEITWEEILESVHLREKGALAKPSNIPTMDEFLQLFPDNENVDARANLLTTQEIKDAFKGRGWEVTRYAALRDRAVTEGHLGIIVGAKNLKLTGLKKYTTQPE
jgi:hypothetical protein